MCMHNNSATRCRAQARACPHENRLDKGPGRPVSRILLYPAIHLRGLKPRAPWGPRLPTRREECLRRDILACSHRSFTWPVPRGIPPVGSYPTLSPITCAGGHAPPGMSVQPSAGLLSVALDVAAGLRRRRPSGSWPERPLLRVRTLLCTPGDPGIQRRVGRPRPSLIIP